MPGPSPASADLLASNGSIVRTAAPHPTPASADLGYLIAGIAVGPYGLRVTSQPSAAGVGG